MTYREFLTSIDNALKGAQVFTGVAPQSVYIGREDTMKLSAPFIAVYAEPGPYKVNESGVTVGLNRLKVTVFCTVKPAATLVEAMVNAVELCERVEAVLKNHFGSKYTPASPPSFDAHYADYACAEVSFTIPYQSSAGL